MTQKCADPTFGLNEQALAVLQMLSGMTPQFANYNEAAGEYDLHIETFPWYRGRERGFSLVLTKDDCPTGPCLVMTVAEHASCDEIVVDSWEQDEWPRNGPTIQTREAYGEPHREHFKYGGVGAASDCVYGLMKKFYERGRPVAVEGESQ